MITRESSSVNVVLATFLLLLIVSQVGGQVLFDVTVGTAPVKPGIDGQWQQGEWDNTIEYKLLVGSPNPIKIVAYLRMMHDSQNLFGIIDALSDNGAPYVTANGDTYWGGVLLLFYYGAFLNPKNQTQLYTQIALSTNQTNLVNVGVSCRCPGVDPNQVSSHSRGATSLSVTPHSSSKHRVWEFSLPIYPYVIATTLDKNPTIGFDVIVIDSSGNPLSLVMVQHARLVFVSATVPEILSGQMMLPLSLLTPLFLLFVFQRKRTK